mgnify:FL=1
MMTPDKKRFSAWCGRGMSLLVGWGLMLGAGVTLFGCANEQPKPPTKEAQQQIRSDSDRFFEKMKQEERERGKVAP